MTEPVGIRERTGQQATDEQATGEVATVEHTISQQPVGEQASGEQATGEQITSEQATGEQAIADFNGRHFKLSCFQPIVSPPACPAAAAAAAETILYLVNERMTTALQWKPFPAKRNTLAKRTQFAVGQRRSSTYASRPTWLTPGNSPGLDRIACLTRRTTCFVFDLGIKQNGRAPDACGAEVS